MRELALSGELPSELFTLQNLTYLLLSNALLTGGIPTPTIGSPTRSLQLLTLTACGLGGEIPQWLVNLPNLTAVELSGNDFTGPIPAFPLNTQLTQFSATNNRFTGTLESFRHATLLKQLDVGANQIGGIVEDWVVNRSQNMTLLWMSGNYLSCELPDIAGHGRMNILRGNLFGCPVPHGVQDTDSDADTYSCGSEKLEYAVYFFIAVLSLSIVVCAFISACLSS